MDDRERSELLERLSLEFASLVAVDAPSYPGSPNYDGVPLKPQQRTWSKIRFFGFSADASGEEPHFSYGWISKICGLRSDGRYFVVGVYLIDGFEFEDPEQSIRQFLQEGWEYFDSYRCCSCGMVAKGKPSPCLLHGDSISGESIN